VPKARVFISHSAKETRAQEVVQAALRAIDRPQQQVIPGEQMPPPQSASVLQG
jgi:hypothetical protein